MNWNEIKNTASAIAEHIDWAEVATEGAALAVGIIATAVTGRALGKGETFGLKVVNWTISSVAGAMAAGLTRDAIHATRLAVKLMNSEELDPCVIECSSCHGRVRYADRACPHCGVVFDDDADVIEGVVVTA